MGRRFRAARATGGLTLDRLGAMPGKLAPSLKSKTRTAPTIRALEAKQLQELRVDVKVITDDSNVSEYVSSGGDVCSLTLYPLVSISIVRGFEIDENGVRVRPPWNPNDSLPLTKYNVAVFLKELKEIANDMKIKESKR